TECPVWEHLGIYAFTKEFLLKFVELPPTPLMKEESLEQLRILEHGYTMAVIPTKYPSMGPNVNTEEDLQIVRKILAEEKDKNRVQ
ncbi:MAG: 3-deoxy-manno-octulosonate cytidylyltransferase, partial [Synergistaceae bacterium]|nr:3-deoxy-manno-octulosonate cytidylyltransferase [Synergistaceae bacterium]